MAALRDDELAGLKSANTVLRAERDAALAREAALAEALAARSAELARCNSEYGEAAEQQAATDEILQIINASPGDLSPVFDAVLERAMRLCEAAFGSLYTYDGERFHSAAQRGVPAAYADFRAANPPASQPGGIIRRVLEANRPIQVLDVAATDAYRAGQPSVRALADLGGAQTNLLVPLRKDEAVLGVISIYRQEVRAFSDRQIALLENFAAQAVIAMENARLLGELQQRTSDLQESLEYQTATGDVLKVISQSTFDLPPVLETLLETAARLCDADLGAIAIREGDVYRMAASYNPTTPEYDAFFRGRLMPADRGSVTGRTVLEGRIIHVADVTADPEFALAEAVKLGGARTVLGVPLLREGAVAGVIILGRKPVQPFADRQIELVATFADQAVIAIENTRLLTEQREALEQQTATAEVLQVINASPGNLEPVFDAMLEKATRLCEAQRGQLATFDGEHFCFVAVHGDVGFSEGQFAQGPVRPEVGVTWPRIAAGEQVVHMVDVMDTDLYRAGHEGARRFVDVGRGRTLLTLALRKDDVLLGALTVYRQEVRPFTVKQIALLQNFAAQAVIAMENARLLTETREALEQQIATAEVLQVINGSPGNLAPIFETILEKAHSLCGATKGAFLTFDGEHFQVAATRGLSDAYTRILRGYRQARAGYPVDEPSPREQLLNGANLVHLTGPAVGFGPVGRAVVELEKIGTVLFVPLRQDRALLGYITAYREEEAPFSDKQIALLQNFAAQAVIAIENARLINETREALEQQTATAEVLQEINSSPGNLTPVFAAVLEKAVRLCESELGIFNSYDGECFHAVATRGVGHELAEYLQKPIRSGPGLALHRIAQGEDVVHIADITDDDAYRSGDPGRRAVADLGGARTQLMVALRKDGTLLGAINIFRQEVRPFSDKQVALVQNFAAQAVIAMENGRLITETREALEQQTATAEVLQVINASPGNVTPVFEAMLEKAIRLCGGVQGALWTVDGERVKLAASRNPPEFAARLREHAATGVPEAVQQTMRSRLLHIPDFLEHELYLAGDPIVRAAVELGGFRSWVGVALVKDDAPVGAFVVGRRERRPFTEKQIALLQNFAAQAVIAMENARLINETREALAQQTATTEVLQVINSSPGDLAPVFDAMLDRAMRLCDGAQGTLWMFDGGRMRATATAGYSSELAEQLVEWREIHPYQRRLSRGERVFQIIDLAAEELYRSGNPLTRAAVDIGGIRTVAFVALVKDAATLGGFTIGRREVRAFTDKQIALLQNFAAQAVIAMENARLLTETREALEQQTATAEVLRVINSSPGDLAPVFDAIMEKAHRLCGAADGALVLRDGETFRAVATHTYSGAFTEQLRQGYRGADHPIIPSLLAGARFVHIPDLAQIDHPMIRAAVELAGSRTGLYVPLRKDNELLGMISSVRREIRPFSDKEIALVENFAAQAVIAMENVRLITETREALEQQTATAEVLQVINSSPGDLEPVFETLLDRAMRLCGANFGEFQVFDGERLRLAAFNGVPGALAEFRRNSATIPTPGPMTLRMRDGANVIHTADLMAEDAYREGNPHRRALVDLGGARTVLAVALRKDDKLLGAINIYRQEVKPFSDRQVALLQSFAAQAIIAMENARLLTETREALEQQTATAEVLQVINASPGNLPPVFDTILEKALHLCESPFGLLATYDGEFFRTAAQRGLTQGFADLIREPFRPHPGLHNERLVRGEQLVHVSDITGEAAYRTNPTHRALADQSGARTAVWIALRRDDTLLGVINIYRQEVRPFSDRQIELLRGFATQAVIAIDNARLLTELRQRTDELARRNSEYGERIEHQSATIDVLKTMSASPGDAQPVFELIAQQAAKVCDVPTAAVALYDGTTVHLATHSGFDPAYADMYASQFPRPVGRDFSMGRAILSRQVDQVEDIAADPGHSFVGVLGHWSVMAVPMLRDGEPLGAITIGRPAARPFSTSQTALLQTFAEQAVIAISSAETYRELQERTAALARRNSEYGERIEQQSATIDVLKAMSASSGDAQPVFRLIVERARAFCEADGATLALLDGDMLHLQAYSGFFNREYAAVFPRPVSRATMFGRAILARDVVQAPDVSVDADHYTRNIGQRAIIAVPLLRAGTPIGAIAIGRRRPGEFSAAEVELLKTFAEQAVIAISSAETFSELQRRTADLSRSVAELQALEEVLRAVNSSLELETVLSTIISRAVQLSDADEGTIYEFDDAEQVFVPRSAYGMTEERVTTLRDRRIRIGETPLGNSAAMRAPLHIPDLSQTPDIEGVRELVEDGIHALLAVPLLRDDKVLGGLVIRRRAVGGFAPTVPTLLQTFAGQCVLAIENARLFQDARQARIEAETTLADLRRTQDRLVQSEKMASLGQLTAGIAHEIKNPLNFVNNFSELSVDLLDELHAAVAPDRLAVADGLRNEIDELTATLKGNLEKIGEHGRRADSIVKNMLLHSRSGPGEHRMVDLNSTVEEALNLAYHGARAATPGFNITMERRLDPQAGMVDMYPQEITRVLLNLIGNGFYAAHKRAEAAGGNGFEPTLKLTTRNLGDEVEIRVRDNGTGISEAARDRIFEPFFTTKPAGEGTGLGLSLSYEIIVQQHGGRLTVDSEPDAFTEFVVTLRRKLAATNGGQA